MLLDKARYGANRYAHRFALAFLLLLMADRSRAECSVDSSGVIDMASVSSVLLETTNHTVLGQTGLVCTVAPFLGVAVKNHLKVNMQHKDEALTDEQGHSLPFEVQTQNSTLAWEALEVGVDKLLSSTDWGFFQTPGSYFPLAITIPPTSQLHAGTYTGNVTINWYYSICQQLVGSGPLCMLNRSESPGIELNFFTADVTSWGTGAALSIAIRLVIHNDCVINARDIDFGRAPFVTEFDPVTSTIEIRCTAGSQYSVGLSDGGHYGEGSRRMESNGHYILYELYKSQTSLERWGSSGTERRLSGEADVAAGLYDGLTWQKYIYRAEVTDQRNDQPVGRYTDNIVVDVTF